MNIEVWWMWIGLGGLFIIGEIFTAGFFLLWFGIAALVSGALAYLGVGFGWQGLAFVVVSGALLAATRKLANRLTKKQPPGIGADRLIGKTGIVLEEIDNDKNTGRVRVDEDEWRVDSEAGEIIQVGKKIEVIRLEGTRLIVKLKKEEG
ncbi:MAG: NfeD family protein [Candidatus Omnitrophica bacterium]|nr:NfeD family protein [Candidatus Omnitrophota bacterium]